MQKTTNLLTLHLSVCNISDVLFQSTEMQLQKVLKYKWKKYESDRLTIKHDQAAKCALYEEKGLENSIYRSRRVFILVIKLYHQNNTYSYLDS